MVAKDNAHTSALSEIPWKKPSARSDPKDPRLVDDPRLGSSARYPDESVVLIFLLHLARLPLACSFSNFDRDDFCLGIEVLIQIH